MALKRNVALPGVVRDAILGQLTNFLTATGSVQTDALILPSDVAIFTTVASNTGCILPPSTDPADECMVTNHGANTLKVYPPSGGKIANGSANAAFSVAATKSAIFKSIDGTNYAAFLSA